MPLDVLLGRHDTDVPQRYVPPQLAALNESRHG